MIKTISPECSRDRHGRCNGGFKVETKEGGLIAFCMCMCHRKEEAVVA
jgi:hypothetical protein